MTDRHELIELLAHLRRTQADCRQREPHLPEQDRVVLRARMKRRALRIVKAVQELRAV